MPHGLAIIFVLLSSLCSQISDLFLSCHIAQLLLILGLGNIRARPCIVRTQRSPCLSCSIWRCWLQFRSLGRKGCRKILLFREHLLLPLQHFHFIINIVKYFVLLLLILFPEFLLSQSCIVDARFHVWISYCVSQSDLQCRNHACINRWSPIPSLFWIVFDSLKLPLVVQLLELLLAQFFLLFSQLSGRRWWAWIRVYPTLSGNHLVLSLICALFFRWIFLDFGILTDQGSQNRIIALI